MSGSLDASTWTLAQLHDWLFHAQQFPPRLPLAAFEFTNLLLLNAVNLKSGLEVDVGLWGADGATGVRQSWLGLRGWPRRGRRRVTGADLNATRSERLLSALTVVCRSL
jgi:hypothetical protein